MLSHTWELLYPTAARPGESFTLTASVHGVGTAKSPVVVAGVEIARLPVAEILP